VGKDERDNYREQRAESREQREERREQRTKSREQRGESREQRAKSKEQKERESYSLTKYGAVEALKERVHQGTSPRFKHLLLSGLLLQMRVRVIKCTHALRLTR
jgi:hypothetical protein